MSYLATARAIIQQGKKRAVSQPTEKAAAFCPWCKSRRLIEGRKAIWCDDCSRAAWLPIDGGYVRADCKDTIIVDRTASSQTENGLEPK